MPTYNQVADDIMVTMGYVHDDANRSKMSVLYNIKLAADKLKKQSLSKDLEGADYRGMADLLSTFIVPVTYVNVPDDSTIGWDHVYFDLPTSVYELDYGSGISFVRYLQNDIPYGCPPAIALQPFTQATLASLAGLYGSAYQRPSPSRPYIARARELSGGSYKDRVYVFGIKQGVTHLLVGLYAAPDFSTIDPDEDIGLPDHLVHPLKQMLIDMERFLFLIPQERLKNDGRDLDPNQVVRTERQMSINNPIQLDE